MSFVLRPKVGQRTLQRINGKCGVVGAGKGRGNNEAHAGIGTEKYGGASELLKGLYCRKIPSGFGSIPVCEREFFSHY